MPEAAGVRGKGAASLRYAAILYLVAWAIHTGDHLRRGLGVVTTEVSMLGSLAAVLQLVAIAAVLSRRRWGAMAAVIVGFPDALGIAAVHFLPHWSAFSDAFPGARGTGVTGFSWFAAALEVLGALAFGLAGAAAAGARFSMERGASDRVDGTAPVDLAESTLDAVRAQTKIS